MMNTISRILVTGTFIIISIIAKAEAAQYQIAKLGDLGRSTAIATALNDVGQVVGYSATNTIWASPHAVLWDRTSAATDLGTLWNDYESYALDINNVGVIVGSASNKISVHAASWYQGVMTYRTEGGTYADGINDKGQIVGRDEQNSRGVVWESLQSQGSPTGLVGGAISASGQVVGAGPFGMGGAGVWDGEHTVFLPGLDGKTSISAKEISASGWIIGTANSASQPQAVIWIDGAVTQLGMLSGFATSRGYSINNDGLAVGESSRLVGRSHATLWDHGKVIDLNDYLSVEDIQAGWILTDAVDINASGSIVANAFNYLTLAQTPFLLSAVPEPGTYVMLLVGLMLLNAAVRRRT